MVKQMQWVILLLIVGMMAFLIYKAVSQMDAETAKMVIIQVLTMSVGAVGGYLAGKKGA